MTAKIQVPLTISQVAAMTAKSGWSRKQTKTWLLRMNEALHGLLLIPSGGAENRTWTVYLSSLQKVAPEMFASVRNVDGELEDHEERLATSEKRQLQTAEMVGKLNRKLAEQERKAAAQDQELAMLRRMVRAA